MNENTGGSIRIFSTCPASNLVDKTQYHRLVIEVARWSEAQGCEGILVYTDNSLLDPWIVAQVIVEQTRTLSPLVAVQPVYAHPYAVAKMVASLSYLYDRRIHLNMVAGGFTNDFAALNDPTPHDRRYDRLIEYTTIITRLLGTPGPVSVDGEFYKVDKLRMTPAVPAGLQPGVFVSGSSEAGVAAARAIGATTVKYPKPAHEGDDAQAPDGLEAGIRVGVIARDNEEDAWRVAHARFPEDRKGRLTHQLAMKTSDSRWHRELSGTDPEVEGPRSPYWLAPFQMYRTFCPYLVGSYDRVGQELGRYIAAGYRTVILDVPPSEEELAHTNVAFGRALDIARSHA